MLQGLSAGLSLQRTWNAYCVSLCRSCRERGPRCAAPSHACTCEGCGVLRGGSGTQPGPPHTERSLPSSSAGMAVGTVLLEHAGLAEPRGAARRGGPQCWGVGG